jgi:Domain of unknown function (DU1801)
MAELKTKRTQQSATDFLNAIPEEGKRRDAFAICAMMEAITGDRPAMWGSSIVGFGTYHYVYASGREGDWPVLGFSPRKESLTLYLSSGFKDYAALLEKLGKHKTAKACLYIKKLEDVDLGVLKELLRKSVQYMKERDRKQQG